MTLSSDEDIKKSSHCLNFILNDHKDLQFFPQTEMTSKWSFENEIRRRTVLFPPTIPAETLGSDHKATHPEQASQLRTE